MKNFNTVSRGLIFEFNMAEARLELELECSFSDRKCGRHGMISRVLAMEMLQGAWKQHLRPRAVVGYGVKIFLPSPPNYVTRSPGSIKFNKAVNLLIAVTNPLKKSYGIKGSGSSRK